MNKYKLTDEVIEQHCGRKLHRIQALKDFGDVLAGDLGGLVESEHNLSQIGNAWISGNACASENARIKDDAWINEKAWISGNACISKNAFVGDYVCISDNARIGGSVYVINNARIGGNAYISGNVVIGGQMKIDGNARIFGDVWIEERAHIGRDARITNNSDIIQISNIGSGVGTTTFFRDKDNGISVSCERFIGTMDEFEDRVKRVHGDDKYGKEYMAAINMAKIHMEAEG